MRSARGVRGMESLTSIRQRRRETRATEGQRRAIGAIDAGSDAPRAQVAPGSDRVAIRGVAVIGGLRRAGRPDAMSAYLPSFFLRRSPNVPRP